ncbi:MAG TPA: UPF0758 domain-containing protein, partial [Anseongella sp.]|nr:UPF0758 domain-containing protein [Anseongella sp.]
MLTFEKRISIKAWAEEDRPREKLLQKGRHNLSEAELVAILIGTGNDKESALELSKRILQSCGNQLDRLGKLTVNDLLRFHGIGQAKATSIVAALELGRRRKEAGAEEGKRITGSSDVFKAMLPFMEDLSHEEFWMMALNRA